MNFFFLDFSSPLSLVCLHYLIITPRLPMPDGFTPVSVELFDSQVSLIATKYTLQGINVLVHCRGEFPPSLRLRPRDRACVLCVCGI